MTLCITGVIPLLLAGGLNAGDRVCLFCTSLLLVLVACAVFLFVWWNDLRQLPENPADR